MKKIVMIVGENGYRDEELQIPKDFFTENGAEVKVASTNTQKATGKLGGSVVPDLLLEDIDVKEFDAIIFVGGPAAEEYFDCSVAHSIAKNAVGENKLVGAICIAPVILANAGLLTGKIATVFPDGQDVLREKGVNYVAEDVIVDGNIVTANGPQSASKFASLIWQKMNI